MIVKLSHNCWIALILSGEKIFATLKIPALTLQKW